MSKLLSIFAFFVICENTIVIISANAWANFYEELFNSGNFKHGDLVCITYVPDLSSSLVNVCL